MAIPSVQAHLGTPPELSAHKFVFIGGLHRSGTTLVHDCITTHPGISGLENTGVPMNEGQFLQDVYPPAGTRRKLWPIRYFRWMSPRAIAIKGYGGPGRFGFDPGSFLDESSPLGSADNAARIFRSWCDHWDLRKPYLAEKSPPNVVRTRLLQRLFPHSYFIIVYRHPIPVSYATRKWTKYRPLYFLFEHWLRCYERFRSDRPHLRRVLEVRYEEFVASPQRVLDEIYGFLGVPPIPTDQQVQPHVNSKYFQRWLSALRASPLADAMARLLLRRFEPRFNGFGYSLRDLR